MSSEKQLTMAVNAFKSEYQDYRFKALGAVQLNTKYQSMMCEVGIPTAINFQLLYHAYERKALAAAAIDIRADKIWENDPFMVQGDEADKNTDDTTIEKEISMFAKRLDLWGACKYADIYRQVGDYGAFLIHVADARPGESTEQHWSRPVEGAINPDQILNLIPVWQCNLDVIERYQSSDDVDPVKIGAPKKFFYKSYQQDSILTQTLPNTQSFSVHESRVFMVGDIYGNGGRVNGNHVLVPGFNDLAALEMILMSSTNGTAKAASGKLTINFDKDTQMQNIAQLYGVPVTELADAINDQVEDFNTGLDAAIIGQGMDAKGIEISLPDIEVTANKLEGNFAASVQVPKTEFVGFETGERSSTENSTKFNRSATSWQKLRSREIEGLFQRFQQWGMFGKEPLTCIFPSLLEMGPAERLELANGKADILAKLFGTGFGAEREEAIAQSILQDLDLQEAPVSETERRIREQGEEIDEEINNLPD